MELDFLYLALVMFTKYYYFFKPNCISYQKKNIVFIRILRQVRVENCEKLGFAIYTGKRKIRIT